MNRMMDGEILGVDLKSLSAKQQNGTNENLNPKEGSTKTLLNPLTDVHYVLVKISRSDRS